MIINSIMCCDLNLHFNCGKCSHLVFGLMLSVRDTVKSVDTFVFGSAVLSLENMRSECTTFLVAVEGESLDSVIAYEIR